MSTSSPNSQEPLEKKSLFNSAKDEKKTSKHKSKTKKDSQKEDPNFIVEQAEETAGYLKDVAAEMKRVTWPSGQDVLKWSLATIGFLAFFIVFTLVIDNLVATPLLYWLSGFALA